MLPSKLPSLRSYTMGWPVGTAAGGTTMEVKVLLTTLTLTEISARDPPARLPALACRPRVKLLSAPTACTSVLNVSKSTDATLNAGKSTKLQRTANLNSAEIRLCNLQGEAEQVILDPLMESHGSLFGQALIQRKFKILHARSRENAFLQMLLRTMVDWN